MGRSKTTGIQTESSGTFSVDSVYKGQRIRQRGFTRFVDAEEYLIRSKERIRLGASAGTRPKVTLDEAAAKHLDSKLGMPSWETDRYLLAPIVKQCGSLTLDEICDETLEVFVETRLADGMKTKTINNAIDIVQTICNRAADTWRHPNGETYLAVPPKLTRLPLTDARPPRPISWAEQRLQLMPALPPHLERMALFDLNTGLRKEPLCQLRWDWEVPVILGPGLKVSVFVVPRRWVKGRKSERIVVCNSVAQSIIESQRGLHAERVFTYAKQVKPGSKTVPKHKPVASMNNTAWQKARKMAGLGDLHVHDLRHTVGMRLRDAGVSERTQDEILWHAREGMTAHYAVAQVREIYNALELITRPSAEGESMSLLTLVRNMRLQEVTQNSPSKKKAA